MLTNEEVTEKPRTGNPASPPATGTATPVPLANGNINMDAVLAQSD